jgi:hypothetical protein
VFQGYFSTIDEELDKSGKMMFSITNEEPIEVQKTEPKKTDLQSELQKLKDLFEKGLIPQSVYEKKVEELL